MTLKFLAESPSKLAISNFSDGEFRPELYSVYWSYDGRAGLSSVYCCGPPNVFGDCSDALLTDRVWIVQVQGSNIRHYYAYLLGRAKAYRDTRIDWVREGQGRLKRQTVDKGLLRETETVQSQIAALLKCDVGCGCNYEGFAARKLLILL